MKTHKLLISIIICIVFILNFHFESNAQIQKGNDILGEMKGDWAGNSISMPDINTIAIGAPMNDENGMDAGSVRIFKWDGNKWVQKGNDLDGIRTNDFFGISISMSDSNTIAIGAYMNDGNETNAGQVQIFNWDGFNWVQKGSDIYGNKSVDHAGHAVDMPDKNTIAIGAPQPNGNTGYVQVFYWDGESWIQKGNDIEGELNGEQFGSSLDMPNTNTIAIGTPMNDENGDNAGNVRVYYWNGSLWIQKGNDIVGESSHDMSGISVSMPNEMTVAIGAHQNSENGLNSGHVRIFTWDGSNWMQKGADLDGIASHDLFGYSVFMPNSTTVSIGAPGNCDNGFRAGRVYIFIWDGIKWVSNNFSLFGDYKDEFGKSVCMPNANTLAVGAPRVELGATNFGYVRVYTINNVGMYHNTYEDNLSIYPIPTDEYLNIDLGNTYSEINIIVRNILGQEVNRQIFRNSSIIQYCINEVSGTYYIEVVVDDKKIIKKVILE